MADDTERQVETDLPTEEKRNVSTLEEKCPEVKSQLFLQLISVVIVNLKLVAAGLMFTWSAVSMDKLLREDPDIRLTSEQGGWVATILYIGACFGPSLSMLLIDRIGRKWFLYLMSLPTVACWLLIYFAKNWAWIMVARFLGGVPLGAIYAMVPLYLGELVETRIRGAAGAMMALALNVGYIFMYGVGPLVDRKTLCLISLVPTAVYMAAAPWIPDSPYYHLKKGNRDIAKVTLAWLRRREDNAAELDEMLKMIDAEKAGGFKELFGNRTSKKAFLLLLLLLTGQQFSGLAAIQSYYGIIIDRMKIPLATGHVLLIISAINVASSVISTLAVDRMGRKPVYLVSSLGTTACLSALGAYFLMEHRGDDLDGYSAVPLVAVLLYTILFSFGMAQIPSVVQSEVFPINVKTRASTLANTYGSVLGLIVTKSFQSVVDAWGYHVIFLAFAGLELIVAAAVIVVMPETKQKSFAEIQELLRNGDKKNRAVQ